MRVVKISILLIMVFFIVALNMVVAQREHTSSPHRLGIQGCMTTGGGLSYKYFPNKIGVQITLFHVVDRSDFGFTIMGANGLFKIKENDNYTIYNYTGGGLLSKSSYQNKLQGYTRENIYTVGTGIGFNFSIGKKYEYSFQTGILTLFKNTIYGVYPSAGMGFYYLTPTK